MATDYALAVWAATATLAIALAGVASHELNAPAWVIKWVWAWSSAFAGTLLATLVMMTRHGQ